VLRKLCPSVRNRNRLSMSGYLAAAAL
jgi:hypothetical protein